MLFHIKAELIGPTPIRQLLHLNTDLRVNLLDRIERYFPGGGLSLPSGNGHWVISFDVMAPSIGESHQRAGLRIRSFVKDFNLTETDVDRDLIGLASTRAEEEGNTQ